MLYQRWRGKTWNWIYETKFEMFLYLCWGWYKIFLVQILWWSTPNTSNAQLLCKKQRKEISFQYCFFNSFVIGNKYIGSFPYYTICITIIVGTNYFHIQNWSIFLKENFLFYMYLLLFVAVKSFKKMRRFWRHNETNEHLIEQKICYDVIVVPSWPDFRTDDTGLNVTDTVK